LENFTGRIAPFERSFEISFPNTGIFSREVDVVGMTLCQGRCDNLELYLKLLNLELGFAIVVENVLDERLVLSLLLVEPGPVWLVPPWAKTLHLVGFWREALLIV
jgi:hypothetical protein